MGGYRLSLTIWITILKKNFKRKKIYHPLQEHRLKGCSIPIEMMVPGRRIGSQSYKGEIISLQILPVCSPYHTQHHPRGNTFSAAKNESLGTSLLKWLRLFSQCRRPGFHQSLESEKWWCGQYICSTGQDVEDKYVDIKSKSKCCDWCSQHLRTFDPRVDMPHNTY